jgi:large subunit ribosomal protein L4
VHGPQPRSYDYAFPRKKVVGALRSALAAKYAEGKLIVVDSLVLDEPKTKLYRAALDALDAKRTVLIVESGQDLAPNTILGARNLDRVELLLSTEVHAYDILRNDRAIFSKSAFETLQDALKKTVSKRRLLQARKAQVA